MRISRIISAASFTFLVVFISVSCTTHQAREGEGLIWPDYVDVTVPYNIAPLNFCYNSPDYRDVVTTFSCGNEKWCVKGLDVVWDLARWHKFMELAKGDSINVSNSKGDIWSIYVSEDPVDGYLTYRLIEPGYEVWHEVEIRERCIENFDEKVLCDYKHTGNACMNCHIHGQARGDYSLFYVRGKNGGSILNRGGSLSKLQLKDSTMISSTVYGDLHPSGRWGVFSTNIIFPAFHSQGSRRFEVYDIASDLAVADFDEGRMITDPVFSRADIFETFPTFSADGHYVYYCSADTVALPSDINSLRYSLLRTPFNDLTGQLGPQTEVVWDASEHNASICHPRCSPDGRWLLYTVADFGTFPIWHQECDLELMDLETGDTVPMDIVNDFRSDTYHSWSSNGRWVVFASKRGDGQYGKPYFFHISEDGMVTKPFVLPQKDPYFYDRTTRSFNIPDLGKTSVPFDVEDVAGIL